MEGEEEGFLSLVRVQQCRMSQMERVTVLELGTGGMGILGWLSLNVTKPGVTSKEKIVKHVWPFVILRYFKCQPIILIS